MFDLVRILYKNSLPSCSCLVSCVWHIATALRRVSQCHSFCSIFHSEKILIDIMTGRWLFCSNEHL